MRGSRARDVVTVDPARVPIDAVVQYVRPGRLPHVPDVTHQLVRDAVVTHAGVGRAEDVTVHFDLTCGEG